MSNKLFITLEEFNSYSGNYDDDTDTKKMKCQLLASAQDIVEDYLGYKLEQCDHEEDFTGTGSKTVYLHNLPVQYVYDVKVNDHRVDQYTYKWDEESVTGPFKNNDIIYVRYTSGYGTDKIPALIKTTILRIATLLLSEMGENIAVTSKSFSDGSRQFVNYTNFDKFLKPIDMYKAVVL